MDIKKSAKAGQLVRSSAIYPSFLLKDVRFFCAQNACKVMAKDLVRTRRYVQKFYQMRTQLQAVGLRIQTLRSNQQMADAMRGATRVRPFLSLLHLHPPLTPLLSPSHLILAPTSANADDRNLTSLC
jgi:Snf7